MRTDLPSHSLLRRAQGVVPDEHNDDLFGARVITDGAYQATSGSAQRRAATAQSHLIPSISTPGKHRLSCAATK